MAGKSSVSYYLYFLPIPGRGKEGEEGAGGERSEVARWGPTPQAQAQPGGARSPSRVTRTPASRGMLGGAWPEVPGCPRLTPQPASPVCNLTRRAPGPQPASTQRFSRASSAWGRLRGRSLVTGCSARRADYQGARLPGCSGKGGDRARVSPRDSPALD